MNWSLRVWVPSCLFVFSVAIRAQQAPPPRPMDLQMTAPITGGNRGAAFGGFTDDTRPAGYIEEERFFSGSARSYVKDGAWSTNGRWGTSPGPLAPFTVRMLVRRPSDPARFNGVLVVEWLNVSSNAEGAADYLHMQEEIVRGGYAWVGIGAQAAGVNAPRSGLKAWDPVRYAPLVHPGDRFSYDIFRAGANALRHPGAVDPLGGLRIRTMLATGRSQSAFRLVTYINALHLNAPVFDGFLVHSRGANASGLSSEGLSGDTDVPVPPGAHIREDINVPVLDVVTEGDMAMLRAHLTRQDANAHYRRWEIAGAAHAETPRWVVEVPPALDRGPGCKEPVNAAPHHAVMKAALDALTRWVRDGVAPPQSPAIEIADPAAADPIARDANGLARGGIRLPQLEAPTAILNGTTNSVAQPTPGAPNFCFLFGNTVPFEPSTIATLYPSHDDYVRKFSAAAETLVRQGYWLKPEADEAIKAARESHVGAR